LLSAEYLNTAYRDGLTSWHFLLLFCIRQNRLKEDFGANNVMGGGHNTASLHLMSWDYQLVFISDSTFARLGCQGSKKLAGTQRQLLILQEASWDGVTTAVILTASRRATDGNLACRGGPSAAMHVKKYGTEYG
jgi:hypothetical protein